MKAYMGFSRANGPEEGAILIIANKAKEAKRLAWKGRNFLAGLVDEYTDLGIKWFRYDDPILPLADQGKLQAGESHVVVDPICCQHCEIWGAGVTADNLCGNCNEPPGEALIARFVQFELRNSA